jgi:hypothetical protein
VLLRLLLLLLLVLVMLAVVVWFVLVLVGADDHWTVSVVQHILAHAAHDGTTQHAESTRPHHDHRAALFLSKVDNQLSRTGAEHGLNAAGHAVRAQQIGKLLFKSQRSFLL